MDDRTSPPLAPVDGAERVASVDILRGVALFGVLVVNLLTGFRVSLIRYVEVFHTHPGRLNRAVDLFVGLTMEFRAFALFSLLFGVGVAIQTERVCARGARLGTFLARRFAALCGIGLVHATLLWNGDILTEYALCGLVAIPLLRRTTRELFAVAMALLALHALPLPIPDFLPHGAAMERYCAEAERVYGHGSYTQIVAFRAHETARYILPMLAAVFPRTLGLVLLGVCAWREGVIASPAKHRTLLRAVAAVGLAVGGLASITGAVFAYSGRSFGKGWPLVNALSTTLLALGYGAALLLLLQRERVRALLAPVGLVGRASLTNYIAQSVVWGFVFYGYGLGLFGRLGAAVALPMGVALYVAQAMLSRWWLRRHRFGPLEGLWRALTYGRSAVQSPDPP